MATRSQSRKRKAETPLQLEEIAVMDPDSELEQQQQTPEELKKQQLAFVNKILGRIMMTPDVTQQIADKVESTPGEKIMQSAVAAVGSTIAATDASKARRFNHYFLNTLKPDEAKATDQSASGRCWIYAGLNVFRHLVGAALGTKDFEFSQNYLYFWDKYERANTFMLNVFETKDQPTDSRVVEFILGEACCDGGYWNMFSALVQKYGLVPKNAMQETWQSGDSEDMVLVLRNVLLSAAPYIRECSKEQFHALKLTIMEQIYKILVKYLGTPPTKFSWIFITEDGAKQIPVQSPQHFKEMVLPGIDLRDYVQLTNIDNPDRLKKMYALKYSNNIAEMPIGQMLNVSLPEMKKAVEKSIMGGHPVWMACDVIKDYQYYLSALDPDLIQNTELFGSPLKTTKGKKIEYGITRGIHAMTMLGLNFDHKERISDIQVENSWGFWDHEARGLDGFLHMSVKWFDENVTEIVVNKNYLTRTIQKLLEQPPILLEPWDQIAKAVYVKGRSPPSRLREYWKSIRTHPIH